MLSGSCQEGRVCLNCVQTQSVSLFVCEGFLFLNLEDFSFSLEEKPSL